MELKYTCGKDVLVSQALPSRPALETGSEHRISLILTVSKKIIGSHVSLTIITFSILCEYVRSCSR